MHKLLLPSFLAALAAVCPLAAQEPAPASPAAPAKTPPKTAPVPSSNDPFVRDSHTPKSTPPAPFALSVGPTNILITVETWALSQADFAAFLEGPADSQATYDRLEALAKTGKAKLVGLIGVNTKSGQRAVVESIDEVRYPTEFTPAQRAGEIAFPTAYETRNTGETLEVEPILGPDGRTIEVNLVPQAVRFEGFLDWQPEASAAPTGQAQFRDEKVVTSMVLTTGQPAFLSTATPRQLAEDPGAKQIRLRVLRATAQHAQPSPPFQLAAQGRIEFLVYSLDREAARGVLNNNADSAQSYAAVSALVAKGAAQLETVNAFVTKSGQRAVNEENADYRYPTTSSPPRFDSQTVPLENRQPASFSAYETRNVGVAVEIEPVFGPDARTVDLNVVPHITRLVGMLKCNGAAAKFPPQPVFTTRQVTTSVSSPMGVPVLLGTMSQPTDSGVNDRKDDGRTGLAYIRVTPLHP